MERTLAWQIATVTAIRPETAHVKSFTLTLSDWVEHRAGQHYDVRLTAPDGYQAQRSYSVASEPARQSEIELTVERIDDGEVSSYMHDVLVPGDQIEVRGPIGGYFVWQAHLGGPLLLIAGGSGIVPLMAMLRHRAASGSDVRTRLLFSSRTLSDVIYADELAHLAAEDNGKVEIIHTLTRAQPPDWSGYSRRIDRQMLTEVAAPLGPVPKMYVCGPTLLVESVANSLVEIGLDPAHIKTERFGPTGGVPRGGQS
jgi:ferredoxin-NADP reductase